mgnify:CR=1 FL=1
MIFVDSRISSPIAFQHESIAEPFSRFFKLCICSVGFHASMRIDSLIFHNLQLLNVSNGYPAQIHNTGIPSHQWFTI